MKIFASKNERNAVLIILSVIFVISLFNFRVALRRGRDNERINDTGDISKALASFQSHFGSLPLSDSEGRIKGCGSSKKVEEMRACIWGKDLLNESRLPADPLTGNGYSYFYVSDGKYFQIFASLEGTISESEYNPQVVSRNIKCGLFICNFGRSSGNVPLDKSLEEYENELYDKNKK